MIASSGVSVGNNDLITDCEGAVLVGGDAIDLSALDANSGVRGTQAYIFIGNSAFSAASPANAGKLVASAMARIAMRQALAGLLDPRPQSAHRRGGAAFGGRRERPAQRGRAGTCCRA